VVEPPQEGEPATLALAAPFAGDQTGLLLEFLDLDPNREWSEDERLLVEQVSGQLSLALENANLFTQTQARAEELGKLREISLELTQEQGDLQRVLELLARRAMDLLNSDRAIIWLYHPETDSLQQAASCENRPMPQGGLSAGQAQDLNWQVFTEGQVRSKPGMLAIPLNWQNQGIGVLQVSRSVRTPGSEGAYTPNEQRLAELLSGQGSVVIQNARLLAETQMAYRSLEIRERYQKNIAQAAEVLTEHGSQALPEVLHLLAEASGASQVHFFQTTLAGGSSVWEMQAEWISSSTASFIGKPFPGDLPGEAFDAWFNDLPAGASIQTNRRDSSPASGLLVDLFSCNSLLHIGVVHKGSRRACLSFCCADSDRIWGSEETSALQTAASTLAGTLAREELFRQVQANLAETEALYEASARLNSASSYEEVLTVLRDHTLLGHTAAVSVTVGLFEHSQDPNPVAPDYLPLAHWTRSSAEKDFPSSCTLTDWATLTEFSQKSVYLPKISTDPRFPSPMPTPLQALMPAENNVLAPLTVAGQWIGMVFASFESEHTSPDLFSEAALRRLNSLAGQASVAIQNLKQLREIQSHARQETLTREIGVQISSSLDLDTILKTTARSLGKALGASQVVVRLKSQLNNPEE
jgi:GAF domain-containing protein